SDIYALGATLYHMLTGEPPYDGDSVLQVMLKHLNEPVPDPKKKEPGLSEATRRLVQRMMAKKPEGRFQTPKELMDAVAQTERHLAGGPTPAFMSVSTSGVVPAVAPAPLPAAAPRPAAASRPQPSAV